jgi:hypothetical protein
MAGLEDETFQTEPAALAQPSLAPANAETEEVLEPRPIAASAGERAAPLSINIADIQAAHTAEPEPTPPLGRRPSIPEERCNEVLERAFERLVNLVQPSSLSVSCRERVVATVARFCRSAKAGADPFAFGSFPLRT